MSALSDYAENVLLDHALGVASVSSPSTIYLALFLDDPTDADTGTEVSGGSYARQAVSFNSASGGSSDNGAKVTFPTATADWGEVTHVGLYDASSGGNLWFHGRLADSELVQNGDTFEVLVGELVVTLD